MHTSLFFTSCCQLTVLKKTKAPAETLSQMRILNSTYLTCYKIWFLVIITSLYSGGRRSHSNQNEPIVLHLFRKKWTYLIPAAQIHTHREQPSTDRKKGKRNVCWKFQIIYDTFWHVHHTDTHNSSVFVHLAVCDGRQCRKQESFQRGKLHGNKVIFNCPAFSEAEGCALWQRAMGKVGLICSSARVLHLTQIIKIMI